MLPLYLFSSKQFDTIENRPKTHLLDRSFTIVKCAAQQMMGLFRHVINKEHHENQTNLSMN